MKLFFRPLSFLFLLFFLSPSHAKSGLGILFLAGIRYDDLRMCVATPAGVKGGPIADIMASVHIPLDDHSSVGCNIPVMRPVLFGTAFHMLQFEPEFTLTYTSSGRFGHRFFIESGIGPSFHWGPDYTTERDAKVRDNFFAAGPIISSLFGLRLPDPNERKGFLGLRLFYTALFSKERPRGTVIGTAIEGGFNLF